MLHSLEALVLWHVSPSFDTQIQVVLGGRGFVGSWGQTIATAVQATVQQVGYYVAHFQCSI